MPAPGEVAEPVRNRLRVRSIFHVAFDYVPSFGNFCTIAIEIVAGNHALVEFGANVARLKVDDAQARMSQLKLDGHGKARERCFGGIVSCHEGHWKPGS